MPRRRLRSSRALLSGSSFARASPSRFIVTATTRAARYRRGPWPATADISLARGAPSLDIVAVDDLKAAADRAFTNDPKGAFSYGTSAGYGPLVEWIASGTTCPRSR